MIPEYQLSHSLVQDLWLPMTAMDSQIFSENQWHWLTNENSLSQRLRQATAGEVEHFLHFADWGEVDEEKEQLPQLIHSSDSYWIREIEWRYQGEKLVFGRVIIPEHTLIATKLLAETPYSIGDILFKDASLKRSMFEMCVVSPKNILYPKAIFQTSIQDNLLWARRSIIEYLNHPLLVIEVFLPTFFELCEKNNA